MIWRHACWSFQLPAILSFAHFHETQLNIFHVQASTLFQSRTPNTVKLSLIKLNILSNRHMTMCLLGSAIHNFGLLHGNMTCVQATIVSEAELHQLNMGLRGHAIS